MPENYARAQGGITLRKDTVVIVTDASGDAVATIENAIGRLERMVLDNVDLELAATIDVTNPIGETAVSGTVADFIPGGSLTADPFVYVGEDLTITVAGGGNAKSGTMHVYWS